MDKPVKFYDSVFVTPLVGFSATLVRDGGKVLTRTSNVVRLGENGEIETLNTIYKRKDDAKTPA